MARALKTFTTSAGFFDLAIAAPSMKAALEAWGSRANLFHQGFARQTHDAAIVAATLAKPGVVLRRPVGTKAAYREDAELPRDLPAKKPKATRPKTSAKPAPRPPAEADTRQALASFERERLKRESARLAEEQAQARALATRERAIDRAQAALDKARAQHEHRREAIDRRLRAEDARWAKQRAKLETALRRAKRA